MSVRTESLEEARLAVDLARDSSIAGVERSIVQGGMRPRSIRPDASAIASTLGTGAAVLVAGELTVDGRKQRGWVSVEGYDAATKTFTVREPGAEQPTTWDNARMDAFAKARGGHQAVAVENVSRSGPDPLADRLVGAAPAGTRDHAAVSVPLILDEARRAGVTSREQLAYLLAATQVESGMGRTMREKGNGKSADGVDHYFDQYDGRIGNNQPGDGERFRGRGYVQVTGRGNYNRWERKLGLDVVEHPERMEAPDVGARTLVEGTRDGSFTGKKLADYEHPDKRPSFDYERARSIVNPGANSARRKEFASIARGYEEQILKHEITEQIERLAKDTSIRLPAPDERRGAVSEWNGTPRSGTFLKLDDATYVMSVGRGQFVKFDVDRDLGGVAPPEGKPQQIDAKGQVKEVPQPERAPAAVAR